MPIIKSAKKRVKVAAKANNRNTRTRRSLREAMKAFNKAVEAGKPLEVAKTQTVAASAIDVAAKKAVIHKNKAARQKAQLSKRAKAAGAEHVAQVKSKTQKVKRAAPAKKPSAKKATPKKS